MRLLKFNDRGVLSLTEYQENELPRYAILSHTWGSDEDEVTFNDLKHSSFKKKAGYTKIQFCSAQAKRDGLTYFWVDTCCIDKANHSELSEAITLMFRWYSNATQCYVYLSDVSRDNAADSHTKGTWASRFRKSARLTRDRKLQRPVTQPSAEIFSREGRGPGEESAAEQAFRDSRWFKRGWTLQELIAPASVEFFSQGGERLGSKATLKQQIHEITGIPIAALEGAPLSEFRVDERMQWAAQRETKKTEDRAYSLQGIFGVFIPLIYGEGENARVRLQRAISESLSKQSVVPPQPPGRGLVSLPLPRNKNFVGRVQSLQEIHKKVNSCGFPRSSCVKCVVKGMGGIGKTQVILEYAYRYREDFSSVFWIRANSYESAVESYCTIAQKIGLSNSPSPWSIEKDLGRVAVSSVQKWLTASENGNWLLLLDGWDNLNDQRMDSLIPHSGSGVILITSRRDDWARCEEILDLQLMEEAASLSLLSKSSLTDYEQADEEEIVKVLGNLPLAVDQAGAHIHNLKTPARKYLSRLKENRETLSWTPPIILWPYGKGVLSAWDLTFQQLESSSPKVFEILQVCAFLAGEYISENLLKFGFNFAQKDALARVMEDGMGNLFSLSLAKREGDDDGFSIHAVLQTCIRQRLSRSPGVQRQEFAETALLVVAGAVQKLTSERQQNWFTCRQVLSHITSCEEHIDDTLLRKPVFGSTRALFMLGQFCDKFGRHDQAISWFERELNTVPDLSVHSTLECRDGVSTAKLFKGQHNEALAEFRALYTEATDQLGVEHELTNKIANSLGITYKKTGSLEKALWWYRRSLLHIKERFGEKDPRVLASLNNIAVIYKEQTKYREAFEIYHDVLRKKEESLGEEDLSTLETVMNIGILYRRWKRYDEALKFLQRALYGKEKQLGKDDPKTLAVKGNIANVYLQSGRLDEAIRLHEETYNSYKKVCGPEHPEVFTTAHWLGEDYCQKRCYDKSLQWYEEALSGRKRLHGEHNAETLETIVGMAGVFQLKGEYYQALTWYRWALVRFRERFGSEHFGTQSVERQLKALLR
ncbi:hypothetical protein PV08_11192 [Exophiala spinifera]|uniref:Heterokaryon incompatibility domain-containing protein n=1 Tax=Exophiala spinifera TaxID=91928 RepID=A0A0D1Y5N1_9EURO|nr:uncharacterized protein PV08_11192 [Exophiala spinifera]KIW10231.1 hypothetical protein PV08_11192 [Exophiala spinifera]